jgi:hypothetical protein
VSLFSINPNLDTTLQINSHKNLLDKYGFSKSDIIVNEFNATNFTNCSYSHTWLSALGNAKIIMSSANNPNASHIDYHELMDYNDGKNNIYDNQGYGILLYSKYSSIPFITFPVGNVISLLNKNIKNNILKTTFNNKNLYVISSEDPDYIRVILLNQNNDTTANIKFSGFKNLKYEKNVSLGVGVPENFTVLDTGDSISSPSEIRLLNELENAIEIKAKDGAYKVNLSANTLSVLIFRKINTD